MDQAIPTQYEVRSGQIASRNVPVNEESPGSFVISLVFGYQFGNDVHSKISLDRKLHLFHPVKVPASGVQQGSCTQFNQEIRELITKRSRPGHP
jgi:hypothetical protein